MADDNLRGVAMKKLLTIGIISLVIGTMYGESLHKGDRCRLIAGPDFNPDLDQVISIKGSGEECFGVKSTEAVIRSLDQCRTNVALLRYACQCVDPFVLLATVQTKNVVSDDQIKYKGPFYYGYNTDGHSKCYHPSWLEKLKDSKL